MLFNDALNKQKLSDHEIHLWSITPQDISDQQLLRSLTTLLSNDELQKVQRYRRAKAQHNALITRAFVRSVLALYTDLAAHELSFDITEYGKPQLSNVSLPLHFNLSHTDNLIICAVCLHYPIGCDVENLSRKIDLQNIAKRFFSATEFQSLQAVASATQHARFFENWTLKEAFVKATGRGISQGLDTFSFQIGASTDATFNDNITLAFSENSKLNNAGDWYSCLNYLDQQHCIAICANSNKAFRIKYFQGEQYLAATK